MAVLVLAMGAQAAEARCGTDDFGNAVCMDKDGVLTTAQPERAGHDVSKKGASEESADESGITDGRDGRNVRPRCGVDPFGNKVCR